MACWDVPELYMIHKAVAQHISTIRALCREFGVERLEIFGSAVTRDFDLETSDVDFVVTYPAEYDFGPWIKRFFDLEAALVAALGRDVDLIMNGAPKNPRFINEINRTKVEIYDAADHENVA